MLLVYPAVFYKDKEKGYIVMFPDLDNGVTEGDSLEEAYKMAEDYIGTWLYDDFVKGKELPKSSNINDIEFTDDKDILNEIVLEKSFRTLVGIDMVKYVNECKNHTVRKNVSIPSWLNEMGKNYNLNFSNLLQEAIRKELNI